VSRVSEWLEIKKTGSNQRGLGCIVVSSFLSQPNDDEKVDVQFICCRATALGNWYAAKRRSLWSSSSHLRCNDVTFVTQSKPICSASHEAFRRLNATLHPELEKCVDRQTSTVAVIKYTTKITTKGSCNFPSQIQVETLTKMAATCHQIVRVVHSRM